MEFSLIEKILIWVIPVLLAITLHEASHAFVANYYGDPTAKNLKRLSLNPFRHVELVGTFLVPLGLLLLSGFKFTLGWAKPVPVRLENFKKPLAHMAIVAVAGPLSNVVMAIGWAMIIKLSLLSGGELSRSGYLLVQMCKIGVLINLLLAFLNLIPVPPLDGSRIVAFLLPRDKVPIYYKLEPYGILILILLLATGVLGGILIPLVNHVGQFLFQLLGIV